MNDSSEKILFVTGKLAEPALRRVLDELQQGGRFEAEIAVLPISVAALMTPEWICQRIQIAPDIDRVILPGYCGDNLHLFQQITSAQVECGPKDLRKLPQYFGQSCHPEDYGRFDIEIIAEINHAPRLTFEQIRRRALAFSESGADVIDIGCEVDGVWSAVGDCVKQLIDLGLRVSIDSLNPEEIQLATSAGAELVLSVNSSNIQFADSWGAEVVLIPDDPQNWIQMEQQMEILERKGVPFRIDPILEPIGFGFAKSLQRYLAARERWPDLPMMMGIGNLTEMTEVDSAGVNMLLISMCQELQINSVLTTEVIPWGQSSVRECDLARKLAHYAVVHKQLPKHVDSSLVSLRDPQVAEFGIDAIREMAANIKDFNYRILADSGKLHVLGGGHHLESADAFKLFDQLAALEPKNLTPSHAFYLGYELCKATISLHLNKEYTQDEALNWGFLTVEEQNRHRLSKRYQHPERDSEK